MKWHTKIGNINFVPRSTWNAKKTIKIMGIMTKFERPEFLGKLTFEVEVYNSKEQKYYTHLFGSEKTLRNFITAHKAKFDNYDMSVVYIKRTERLNLEEFGL